MKRHRPSMGHRRNQQFGEASLHCRSATLAAHQKSDVLRVA